MPSRYPGPTQDNLNNIPHDLLARDQWILWRGVDKSDQKTGSVTLNKIPINPQSLNHADATDPTTWGTFQYCVQALPLALEEWETANPDAFRGGGIGYVFAADDPYAGIDLDHCVHPDTGVIAPWAQVHVDTFASYTEITPSGTGLHIVVQGALPPKGRKKGSIEMYDAVRFFTMTGWHLAGTPQTCEPRQTVLSALWCQVFGVQVGETVWTLDPQGTITNYDGKPWVIRRIEANTSGELFAFFAETPSGWPVLQCEKTTLQNTAAPSPVLEDTVIIAKMLAATNGAKIRLLAEGHWQQSHSTQSEADLAFCSHCAFYTQDVIQIDRLFRTTGLLRAKWDEPRKNGTYGSMTIAVALADQAEHYTTGTWRVTPGDPFAVNGSTSAPATPGPGNPRGAPHTIRAVFNFAAALPATELLRDLFLQPPRFLVEKLIPDGLTILAAPAKSYKSIFAMSLALATIGEGDWCDTFPVEETGPVVFFGLEAPPMQLRNRLSQLRPSYKPDSPAKPLIFFSGMKALPTFKEGLQDALEQIIERYTPRLIVIDPLSYLYRMGRQDDLASATLDLLWPLAEMAASAKISLFAPEHMRKRSKDDVSVMDQLNGSFIKAAVVHGLLLLRREGEDLILETIMRDAQSQELALTVEFDEQGHRIQWGYKGANAGVREARTTALKAQVLEEVKGRGIPMKVADVMEALLGKGLVKNTTQTRDNIRQILYRGEQAGDLAVSRKGEYYWIGPK